MSEKSGTKDCGCGGGGSGGASHRIASEVLTKVVKAQVPQEYETSINVRIVPARNLDKDLFLQPQCKPRGDAGGWNHATHAIDPGLIAVMAKADKAMVAWLAKAPENPQRFLASPVAAMREAGVNLTRAEEKALTRANEATSVNRVVGPGVNVASLSAKVFPKGRVGGIGPTKAEGKTDDFNCGPKRKG